MGRRAFGAYGYPTDLALWPLPLYNPGMENAEVQQIAGFLLDGYEGICKGGDIVTMQQQLTELCRVIRLP